MTERHTKAEIEWWIKGHDARGENQLGDRNYSILSQLLADRDKLVAALTVYRELEEVAETHGFIQLNAGNYTARNTLKGVGE